MAFKPVVTLIACTLPMLASAQVYTWKDANGRTHFSDQPPSNVDAKPVRGNIVPPTPEAPKTSASTPASASASAPAPASKDGKASGPMSWEDKDRDFKKRQAEKAEAEAKAKKESEAKAEKDRYCTGLRSNLAMLERGGRVAQPDAKGEPSFLSEQQMQQQKAQLRQQIAKDCK